MTERRSPPMPAQQMRGTTLAEESAHVERLLAANRELIAECEREVGRGNGLARKLNAAESELVRLREVLDGTAPAEGSWQTEALALRAELQRLHPRSQSIVDGMTRELSKLRARDEAAKALIEVFRRHGNYTERLYQCGHPLLADALEALVRAHEEEGGTR